MSRYLQTPRVLYQYPQQAYVGMVIPKTKIYQHGSVRKRIKELFISQVSEIRWEYKLSSETLHLQEGDGVEEIQVFSVFSKDNAEPDDDIIETIDNAIPSPIVFELHREGSIQGRAAYKRKSRADRNDFVVHTYFHTQWLEATVQRLPLPPALNLGELYARLLYSLSGLHAAENETLEEHIGRARQIRQKESEMDRLIHTMEKEIQFNRKVELNHRKQEMEAEIERLLLRKKDR